MMIIDHETSSWGHESENSVLDIFETIMQCNQKKNMKEVLPWKNKKCLSYKLGFKNKSTPFKCDGFVSFTHQKQTFLNQVAQNAQVFVKFAIQNLELYGQP